MLKTLNKEFVLNNLLSKNGELNPRALEKYEISKETAYQLYHNLTGPALCQECQKAAVFLSFKRGYTSFCSRSCVSNNKDVRAKKTLTLRNNFGPEGLKSKEIQNKKKMTSLANYGTEHPRQNVEYVDSLKQQFLEKYGTTSPGRTEAANKKRIESNLRKYGTTNPAASKSVRNKIEKTNLEKYGVKTALLLSKNKSRALDKRRESDAYTYINDVNWLEENKNVPSTVLSEQLGIAFSTILNYYKKHNIVRPNIIVSKHEIILTDFLKENAINYISSERDILDGKEIDIYLPEHKIGIEVHGLYWHSENFIKDHLYHAKKRMLALEKGVYLIQITDFEIDNKLNIVKNRILSKLKKLNKVYARKCDVVEIDSSTHQNFMTEYHIQGPAASSVRLGLKHNDQIIAIMSFSKARYNKNYEWELLRYASKEIVVGGASKLFKYFVRHYFPKSIISYADLRWNTGDMYTKIGMKYSHVTKPNYWYISNGQLIHRSLFQKHKLKTKLNSFDEKLSEWENMKNNFYTRFWDCGSNVYVWSK